MIFLAFLLGWLPFVNLYRLEPIPSFWVQMVAFVLSTLLTAWASWRWRRAEWNELTGLAVGLLGLLLCVLAQVYAGMVASRVSAAFTMVILLAGFLFHQVMRCQVPDALRPRLLHAWALGVALAALCQAVLALLATQGLAVVFNELHTIDVPARMVGAFGQPNQFGVFAALSLATMLFLVRVRRLSPYLFVPAWVIGAWMVAASGSRAALCVWALLVFIHWFDTRFVRDQSSWPSISRGRGLWGLHVAFLVLQVLWATKDKWLGRHALSVEGEAGRVLNTRSFSLRFEQYRDAWHLFLDRPILGHGFENFAAARFYLLKDPMVEPQTTHTHNLLTSAVVDFGLIGGLVVLVGVAWVTWGALAALHSSEERSAESRLVIVWSLGLLGYAMLEYPFNYAQFLFAFLFVTAYLPVPGIGVSFREWSILPLARWFFLAVALVLAGWVSADFRRVQALVLDLKEQVRVHGQVVAPPSLAVLTRLRAQSVFPNQVDFHWIMALGVDGDLAEEKIEVVKRLFEQVPGGEQLAWYVVELAAAGREEEAASLMCNYSARAEYEFGLTVDRLRALGKVYPVLLDFLERYQSRRDAYCH